MVNIKIRLITFFVVEDAEAVYSQHKARPGADCGSDHQLLIAKCMLARYNLNQIPYEYERTSLKLNIKKPKITASGPLTLWQIREGKGGSTDRFPLLGL